MNSEQRYTSADLREAVQRKRSRYAGIEGVLPLDRDNEVLAEAYLAEHPADDWEAASREELEQVSLDLNKIERVDSCLTVAPQLCLTVDVELVNPTRGQLRSLLAGLGVVVGEGQ